MTNTAVALRNRLVQPKNVTLKESPEIFRCRLDAMNTEKLANQVYICPASKADFLDTIQRIEFRGERPGKGLDAGTAGMNERAIDVEQYKLHHPTKLNTAAMRGNEGFNCE